MFLLHWPDFVVIFSVEALRDSILPLIDGFDASIDDVPVGVFDAYGDRNGVYGLIFVVQVGVMVLHQGNFCAPAPMKGVHGARDGVRGGKGGGAGARIGAGTSATLLSWNSRAAASLITGVVSRRQG